MKRVLLSLLVGVIGLPLLIYGLGYHGERDFREPGALPAPREVADRARQLIGAPYDPLMGTHGNIGASAGFIVCSDVPNIAYGLAGFSLKQMLARDFARNPSAYDTRDGNRPGNPFFHRRARNLYAYFAGNGRILPPSATPSVGDLVFYRGRPGGYISHVALVTAVTGSGYRMVESAPKTLWAREVDANGPVERGWIPAGFGRMYLQGE